MNKPALNSNSPSHRVTILVLPESSMMCLSSVIDPLRAANRLSRKPLFSWDIVSIDGKPVSLTCGIEIKADRRFSSTVEGELLIVVAGFNNTRYAPKKELLALRKSARHFKTIAGVEAGTWLLARSGIIRHHSVTTHWEDTEMLASSYPALNVRDARYVIDQNIWTCSGASPALDMMLQYLRTTHNKSLALDVASVFVYTESSPPTSAQHSVSLGRIEQFEPRLAQAIRLMEVNLEDPISTPEIADNLNLSVRTLELLYRKYLGITPGAYYLRLRLQAARRLILDTTLPILDVSVRAGFNSPSAFSRAFKLRYRQSPLQLRNSAN